MFEPMTKFMVLIGTMLISSACAQQESPVSDTLQTALYPYRDKSGRFGYADENLHIRLEPQYKMAGLFTGQGFAVITDSLDRKGIIDKNNQVILAPDYDNIQLHPLEDFTLAEAFKSYYTRWRFWEWKFLPGLNLMGSGSDNRLFDTKVKRLKKTVFILGNKNRKVRGKRITDAGYVNTYFDIRTLDSNQVLIDGELYDIREKGARFIASGIIDPLTEQAFAQQKDQRLYIIDRSGKRVNRKGYTFQDSIKFKVEDIPIKKRLTRDGFRPIASAYEDGNGHTFIYPDFSKPLPRRMHDNMHPDDPTAEELIRGLWTLASVPGSEYFLFMSYRDGKRFFRFLDTQGNWHQTPPPGIPFTVVQQSGDILWPEREYYVPKERIPEGGEIERISQLSDDSMYHITLEQDREVRQGIWDFEKKQWLIAPEYYQVYPMDNTRQWRYQPEYGGLWGVMDHTGNILIKPTYSFIHPDGWVEQQDNGENSSFYLHLPTQKEFREK